MSSCQCALICKQLGTDRRLKVNAWLPSERDRLMPGFARASCYLELSTVLKIHLTDWLIMAWPIVFHERVPMYGISHSRLYHDIHPLLWSLCCSMISMCEAAWDPIRLWFARSLGGGGERHRKYIYLCMYTIHRHTVHTNITAYWESDILGHFPPRYDSWPFNILI